MMKLISSFFIISTHFVVHKRMWRNWYTRTLEVRVALPCEFESRHPHILLMSAE